ncbi:putative short-chain dehydrogenase [Xylariales sp. AK1849]|nr:putative short-chain dehydrogenase [Xylariales sp. AK1849]
MALLEGSILVTGCNGGLGTAIIDQILHRPELAKSYYGLYSVRKIDSATRAKAVLEKSKSAAHDHELLAIDLASLASVREAAEKINKRVAEGSLPRIRALVLNAGYQEHDTQGFTNDAFDTSFQSNYLSHFLLTLLLLQSMDKENGRIVVLSSWTHDTADPRNKMGLTGKCYEPEKFRQIFDESVDTEGLAKGTWSSAQEYPGIADAGYRRYGAAKLCLVMMFRELSTRLASDPELSHVSVLAVDPGAMSTEIARRATWLIRVIVMRYLLPIVNPIINWFQPHGDMRTPWISGGDIIRAIFDTETLGEHPNGTYLNGSILAEPSLEAKDEKKRRKLWRDSLGYARVKDRDTVLVDWA